MQGKTCHRCGKKKPYSMFHLNRSSRDGYVHLCKSCIALQNALRLKGKKKGKNISFRDDYHNLDGVKIFR